MTMLFAILITALIYIFPCVFFGLTLVRAFMRRNVYFSLCVLMGYLFAVLHFAFLWRYHRDLWALSRHGLEMDSFIAKILSLEHPLSFLIIVFYAYLIARVPLHFSKDRKIRTQFQGALLGIGAMLTAVGITHVVLLFTVRAGL